MKRSTSLSSSEEVEVACSVGEGDRAAEVAGAEETATSVVTTMESVRRATEAASDVGTVESTETRTGEVRSGGGDVMSN